MAIQNHEIDYKIYGEELQFVEIELDPNETVIGEPGSFMMMDNDIQMQTLFGDGSQSSQQKIKFIYCVTGFPSASNSTISYPNFCRPGNILALSPTKTILKRNKNCS